MSVTANQHRKGEDGLQAVLKPKTSKYSRCKPLRAFERGSCKLQMLEGVERAVDMRAGTAVNLT